MRQIRKVQLRVHAVGVQVHRYRYDICITGSLSVSEQRALDAIRACQQTQLAVRDAGASVVMRVQGD